MDYIQIEQLEVFAYHGCNEEEKINGQIFYVDAKLYTDVKTPGMSDDLEQTINYAKACKFINRFMTENRFDLIEAVAEQTSRALLLEFPKLKAVELTINKPNAPIKLPFGNVAVSVYRQWNKVYLSIGSNMGEKEAYLNAGIEALYDDLQCRVTEVSNFIETKPYGPVEQDNFLNGCIGIETLYSPQELLEKLHEIEAEAGRTREIHWGPRTLDMDIILFNEEVIEQTDLRIPHIEMNKRLFVLEPLNQIAPYAVHPLYKKPVCQLLEELKDKEGIKGGCEGCQGCPAK